MIVIEKHVAGTFPSLQVLGARIEGVRIVEYDQRLEVLKSEVAADIRSKPTIGTLKDHYLMRKYRDFFWKIGVDPTKTRPASEALIRRILAGKPIPTINSFVDSYNIASAISGIPIAAFDIDAIKGSIMMRFSKVGEKFGGIGMEKEFELKGNEVVLEDEIGLIAVYPYRDADRTKVTTASKNVMLLFCGAPEVDGKYLIACKEECLRKVSVFCGGSVVG